MLRLLRHLIAVDAWTWILFFDQQRVSVILSRIYTALAFGVLIFASAGADACTIRAIRNSQAVNLYTGRVISGSLRGSGIQRGEVSQYLRGSSNRPDLVCFTGGYCYPAKDFDIDCLRPDETGYIILYIPRR